MSTPLPPSTRLAVILVCLYVGYVGRYFNTTHFQSVSSTWQAEEHFTASEYASVLSAGFVADFVFKFALGPLSDALGGRWTFLIANFLTGISTIGLTWIPPGSSVLWYSVGWGILCCVRGGTYVGMVKIVSESVPESSSAKAMGLLTTSILVGDICIRSFSAFLLSSGYGWRSIFLLASLVNFSLNIIPFLFLPSTSTPIVSKAKAKNASKTKSISSDSRPNSMKAALLRPQAWFVFFGSFFIYGIREFISGFLTVSIRDVHCSQEATSDALSTCLASPSSQATSVSWSMIFPLCGVLSSLFSGWVLDRLSSRSARVFFLAIVAFISALSFFVLSMVLSQSVSVDPSTRWIVFLSGIVGTGLTIPTLYNHVGGSLLLTLGDHSISGTLTTLNEGIGAFGAALTMQYFSRMFESSSSSPEPITSQGLLHNWSRSMSHVSTLLCVVILLLGALTLAEQRHVRAVAEKEKKKKRLK